MRNYLPAILVPREQMQITESCHGIVWCQSGRDLYAFRLPSRKRQFSDHLSTSLYDKQKRLYCHATVCVHTLVLKTTKLSKSLFVMRSLTQRTLDYWEQGLAGAQKGGGGVVGSNHTTRSKAWWHSYCHNKRPLEARESGRGHAPHLASLAKALYLLLYIVVHIRAVPVVLSDCQRLSPVVRSGHTDWQEPPAQYNTSLCLGCRKNWWVELLTA